MTTAATAVRNATDAEDVWSEVVGQPAAVRQLRAAADAPVHAYLFAGPRGSGKRTAAATFAGELLAHSSEGDEAARHRRLAAQEQHPDLHVVERSGASISREMATGIVREASRSPVEGDRKVLVLDEFHLVIPAAVGVLLKAVEEPPTGTYFLILAEDVTPDLVTIASRCVRIDFVPIPPDAIEAKLRSDGVPAASAAQAAAAAHGDLRRARLLATDGRLELRRRAWQDIPSRLDGQGHTAARLAGEIRVAIDDAQGPLDTLHESELANLEAEVERYGMRTTGLTQFRERQKREKRRFRADELRMGLAELARSYRDRLADSPSPEGLLQSLDVIQATAEGLIRNPNEELMLQALFVSLRPT